MQPPRGVSHNTKIKITGAYGCASAGLLAAWRQLQQRLALRLFVLEREQSVLERELEHRALAFLSNIRNVPIGHYPTDR